MQSKIVALATALVVASSLGTLAHSQLPGGTDPATTLVGGAPFIEAWVDPCKGDDQLGLVGCASRPFLTIGAAQTAVTMAPATVATPGLIHCNPGVYGAVSLGGNGESFPIELERFVNLQGVDARRCILRGDQTSSNGFEHFIPFNPPFTGGVLQPGRVQGLEVLLDLSLLNEDYDEFVDGFTFQGGHIQVYLDSEFFNVEARISNCVFDMLTHDVSYDTFNCPAPDFGILMVHRYLAKGPGIYQDAQVHVLNNTFIQVWAPTSENDIVEGAPGSVAICDTNDPQGEDIDGTIRGIGSPNIQNNLFRYDPDSNLQQAMLGIDSSDTEAGPLGASTPTNAFDPTQYTSSAVYPYDVLELGPNPVPAVVVDTNVAGTPGSDPAFVGEMLTARYGTSTTRGRDWRIMPDSNMIDAGVGPAGGVLMAPNGTAYIEPAFAAASSFDFDGEGYGNSRIVGAAPDIGFDEYELYAVAGGQANDTRTFGRSCPEDCQGPKGLKSRLMLFPGGGGMSVARTGTTMTSQGYGGAFLCGGGEYWWGFSSQFGNSVPPTDYPALGCTDCVWIQTPGNLLPLIGFTTPLQLQLVMADTYNPPLDPTTPHDFGMYHDQSSLNGNVDCQYVNEQVLWAPTENLQQVTMSNLQSFYNGSNLPNQGQNDPPQGP